MPRPSPARPKPQRQETFDSENPPPAFYRLLRFLLRCRGLGQQLTDATELQATWLDPLHGHGTLPLVYLAGQQERVAAALRMAMRGGTEEEQCLESGCSPRGSSPAFSREGVFLNAPQAVHSPTGSTPDTVAHLTDCPLLALYQQWADKQQRAEHKRQVRAALSAEQEAGHSDTDDDARAAGAMEEASSSEGASAVARQRQRRGRAAVDRPAARGAVRTLTYEQTVRVFRSPFVADDALDQAPTITTTAAPSPPNAGTPAPTATLPLAPAPTVWECRAMLEAALAAPAALLARCPLCAALLHLQGIALTLLTLQGIDNVCAAELAVAPWRMPAEVLHMRPMHAVRHVFHAAVRLTRSALALAVTLLSDDVSLTQAQPWWAEGGTARQEGAVHTQWGEERGVAADAVSPSTSLAIAAAAATATAVGSSAALVAHLLEWVHALLCRLNGIWPVLAMPSAHLPRLADRSETVDAVREGVLVMARARLLALLTGALATPAAVPAAMKELLALARHPLIAAPALGEVRRRHTEGTVAPLVSSSVYAAAQSVYDAFHSGVHSSSPSTMAAATATATAAPAFSSNDTTMDAALAELRVVVGLAAIFLSLLYTRDTDDAARSRAGLDTPHEGMGCIAEAAANAAALLDGPLACTLCELCNGTDGGVAARARRLQSLAWTLRAELARVLLASAPAAAVGGEGEGPEPITPQDALRRAAAACDEAREFANVSIVNAVLARAKAKAPPGSHTERAHPSHPSASSLAGTGAAAGARAWRLWPSPASAEAREYNKEDAAAVSEGGGPPPPPFALVPLVWIRMWLLLCPSVFPSSAAELLSLPSSPDTEGRAEGGGSTGVAAAAHEPQQTPPRAPPPHAGGRPSRTSVGGGRGRAAGGAGVGGSTRRPTGLTRGEAHARPGKRLAPRGSREGNEASVQQKQQGQVELQSAAEAELAWGTSAPSFWWRWRCLMKRPTDRAETAGEPSSAEGRPRGSSLAAGVAGVGEYTSMTPSVAAQVVRAMVEQASVVAPMHDRFPDVSSTRCVEVWCTDAAPTAGDTDDALLFPQPSVTADLSRGGVRQFAETALPGAVVMPLSWCTRPPGKPVEDEENGKAEVDRQGVGEQTPTPSGSPLLLSRTEAVEREGQCATLEPHRSASSTGGDDAGGSHDADDPVSDGGAQAVGHEEEGPTGDPPALPSSTPHRSLSSMTSSPHQSPLASACSGVEVAHDSRGDRSDGGAAWDDSLRSHSAHPLHERTLHGMISASLRASRGGSPVMTATTQAPAPGSAPPHALRMPQAQLRRRVLRRASSVTLSPPPPLHTGVAKGETGMAGADSPAVSHEEERTT